MAERPGFLSGWKGNLPQRIGRALVQGFLPGNQRAADGTLDNSRVMQGVAGAGARLVGGMMFGPLGAAVAGKGAGMLIDKQGNPITDPQAQGIPMPQPQMQVGDVRQNLGFSAPQMASNFNPSAYGPYADGYRYPSAPAPLVAPSGFPMRPTGYGVNLPSYGPMPMTGPQVMGGANQNRGGHTGAAAQGIFSGLSDASRFNSSAASFGDYTNRKA